MPSGQETHHYVKHYINAAQINENKKAQNIKIICELLWADDAFYKAVTEYTKSARRDIVWPQELKKPPQKT